MLPHQSNTNTHTGKSLGLLRLAPQAFHFVLQESDMREQMLKLSFILEGGGIFKLRTYMAPTVSKELIDSNSILSIHHG